MSFSHRSSLLRQAIEKHFHVSATVERRLADVYIMTALEGKTPHAKIGDASLGGGSIGWSSAWVVTKPHGGEPPALEMVREALSNLKFAAMSTISAENTSMADFRRVLEDSLERPIIDETDLDGTYDLEVHGNARSTEEFLGMLRDQLGLVLSGHKFSRRSSRRSGKLGNVSAGVLRARHRGKGWRRRYGFR